MFKLIVDCINHLNVFSIKCCMKGRKYSIIVPEECLSFLNFLFQCALYVVFFKIILQNTMSLILAHPMMDIFLIMFSDD